MADLMRRIVAVFSAQNKAKGEMAGFRRDMDSTGRAMQRMAGFALRAAGLGGGLYALKRVMVGSVRAAAEQQKAERALSAAIGQNISQFKTYAAEMQKQTVYGDELIISQMAYAANLGVTTDKLKDATKAAIGLAARYRIDLASAMMLVGRASMGQTQMLTRYGIILDENLSAQDKFNELLRIGADSFGLAEAAARDAAGAHQQYKNAIGDIAEVIGKPLMEGLADMAREVVKNKDTWQEFFQTQTDGWAEVLSGMESTREVFGSWREDFNTWVERKGLVPKGGYTYGQFGGPGMGRMEPVAPPQTPELYISPWAMQQIAKMRAFQREQLEAADKQQKAAAANVVVEEKQAEAVESAELKKMQALEKRVDVEIKMLGKLDAPRQHARMWVDYEEAAMDEFGKGTLQAAEAVDVFRGKLEELEEAQKWAEVAKTMEQSFAGALDRLSQDWKNYGEVAKGVLREILLETMRIMMWRPMAQAAADWIQMGMSGLGRLITGGGGTAPPALTTPRGPAGMGYQHGGVAARPHLAMVGEVPEAIVPLSGGRSIPVDMRGEAGPPSFTFIVENQTGTPMRMEKQRQGVNPREFILTVVVDDAVHGGVLSDIFQTKQG